MAVEKLRVASEFEAGLDASSRSNFVSVVVVAISCVIAVGLIYALFGAARTKFDELALGGETQSVFTQIDGDRVHCASMDEADKCLRPALARNLRQAVVWLGNSQLHAINQLQKGQEPASGLLARRLRPKGVEVLAFSHPSASLVEHLLLFEALSRRLRIDVLVLPLVFDDTRETSIRIDIAKVADDPAMREELAEDDIGRRVLQQISLLKTRNEASSHETHQDRAEKLITAAMQSCCQWETVRGQARGSVELWLYRLRNTVFRITPSSKRRKIPPAYDSNLAAYTRILQRAQKLRAKVVAYVAPIRTDVSPPYDLEEYGAFKRDTAGIAEHYGAHFLNLENLVPGEFWGRKDATSLGAQAELDFMHFQHHGHELLSAAVAEAINGLLK